MSLFVGAISGTSIDGLDLALVEIDFEQMQVVNARIVEFDNSLKSQLVDLANSQGSVVAIGRTGSALGIFTGNAINQFLEDSNVCSKDIRAIGSHGQTIHHFPESENAFSMQIGDGARIAEITGIDTVVDFRSRDIAASGEGAPLVPVFHRELFQSKEIDRVVLNIGGIANVTYLPKDPNCHQKGFDTGPGNSLIDSFVANVLNKPFDRSGSIAASGTVNADLLEQLCSDPWLNRLPPKSTGREHFNLDYLMSAIRNLKGTPSNPDIVATVTEFTAKSISDSILRWCCSSGELIVCGGGRLNSHVMHRLAQHLSSFEVMTSDSLGVDGDFIEATTFAYLAHLFVNRVPGNDPRSTGALGQRVLGCLYPA